MRHTKSSQATIRYLTAFQPRVRRSVYFFQPQLILWTSTISHVFQPLISDTHFYSYKKDEKAAFWYTKAAEQGLPEAQAMLGMLYLLGRGVTRNYAKARHYFEQALQGGELNVEAAVAQYWLGQMYKEGIGVPKDREKGEKLIRLAAINGYAPHGTPREIRQQMREK